MSPGDYVLPPAFPTAGDELTEQQLQWQQEWKATGPQPGGYGGVVAPTEQWSRDFDGYGPAVESDDFIDHNAARQHGQAPAQGRARAGAMAPRPGVYVTAPTEQWDGEDYDPDQPEFDHNAVRQQAQTAALGLVPTLGRRTSSGCAWRLWAARHS